MGIIKKLITLLVIVLVVGLIWGFIGGSKAKDIGTTCDSGIGDGNTICWSWHQNVLGDVQDVLTTSGNAIKGTLNKLN